MTERERLIGLLWKAEQMRLMRQGIDECADYLLANNVVALPELKYKQVLYLIYNKTIKPLEVSSYSIRPEFNNLLQIHLYKNGFNGCCTLDDFGKTVFLTREEAENALKNIIK